MFEQITRQKARFATSRGNVTVEDLWSMPLSSKDKFNLDEVAKSLDAAIKSQSTESFVATSTVSAVDQLKFDVVKHIIAVKLSEAETRKTKAAVAQRRKELMAIRSSQQAAADLAMSPEAIDKELAQLDALVAA